MYPVLQLMEESILEPFEGPFVPLGLCSFPLTSYQWHKGHHILKTQIFLHQNDEKIVWKHNSCTWGQSTGFREKPDWLFAPLKHTQPAGLFLLNCSELTYESVSHCDTVHPCTPLCM